MKARPNFLNSLRTSHLKGLGISNPPSAIMAQPNGSQRPMPGPPNTGNSNGQIALSKAGPSPAAGTEEVVWNEEHLEKAMARLKEMHIQLRNLRTCIPRLLEPLSSGKQPPPEALFREFSESTRTASEEVRKFQELMRDGETIKVLEQARKSRMENPNGIKPWRAMDHAHWLERDT
ncbi:hypothetical protein BJ875DRAFT_448594 [Amylocarpus encephaloides]|uniref:Uncharacterized protein n=1 Tax=Amylocarpus encephaloides TaxID=45428 RepID=A0A9P8CAD4_9HELO|nr:hypothetical protein BJ875DRAFT_448594 [Amylocarpus encephaloides]